jgi:ABC-2 type transport system permease protein
MAKLWTVIKREYLERVRTKWFIIVTVFGPIFFGTVMILPAYLSMKSMKDVSVADFRILDATGTDLGRRVAARISASPQGGGAATQVITLAPDGLAAAETLATHAVMQRETRGYLVLDSSTLTSLTARYAGRNASSLGETEVIEGAIRASLLQMRLEGEGLDAAKVETLTKIRVRMATEKIDEQGRGGSGLASAIFGFAICFLLYFSIIFYGQNILRGVLEEKMSRVAEVILSSVGPDTLLAGKVIGVGAVGLTQQVVWVLSTVLLWNFRTQLMVKLGIPVMSVTFPPIAPMMAVTLLLFFILGYSFYASLFAAVGAMSGSQEEATQAAQPVTLLLVMSVIFAQPVMLNPTGKLAQVMSWLPFSAPIIMPLRMSAVHISGLEIAAVLAGVALACVGAIWLSARIYRVGLLMTGKRPSLRELGRWIQQS